MAIARSIKRSYARPGRRIDARPAAISNLVPDIKSGAWTMNGASQNAVGARFTSAANGATAEITVDTDDNATYEVIFTVAGFVGGSVRALVRGNTDAHTGTGAIRTANGTYTQNLTTSGAGTGNNKILLQANGTSGTNTFDITSVSLRRV